MQVRKNVWAEISKLLREARGELPLNAGARNVGVPPGPLAGTVNEFEELLAHNEFELAWDTMAEMADRAGAPTSCWQKLARAANLMHLPDKEKLAAKRAGDRLQVSD
jgi:hypothetical protein